VTFERKEKTITLLNKKCDEYGNSMNRLGVALIQGSADKIGSRLEVKRNRRVWKRHPEEN
jgi:hypothetical protein